MEDIEVIQRVRWAGLLRATAQATISRFSPVVTRRRSGVCVVDWRGIVPLAIGFRFRLELIVHSHGMVGKAHNTIMNRQGMSRQNSMLTSTRLEAEPRERKGASLGSTAETEARRASIDLRAS